MITQKKKRWSRRDVAQLLDYLRQAHEEYCMANGLPVNEKTYQDYMLMLHQNLEKRLGIKNHDWEQHYKDNHLEEEGDQK